MQIENNEIKSQAVDQKNQDYNHYRKEKYQHVMDQEEPNKYNPSVSSDATSEKTNNIKKIQEQFDFIDSSGPVYLDKTLLNTIVQLCRKEGLISDELAHVFFYNHCLSMDRKYIELFLKNNLHQYDFTKSKINIIDHRRLVEMLLNHNPNKYKIYKPPYIPFDFDKIIRQFLSDIYDKPHQYYYTILDKQVNDHYQSWWGGPERKRAIIDPPVKFYESQEGKKFRQQRENIIRVESQEEEKDRNKRVNQQRTTNMDLMDIAKLMTVKLYGKGKDGKEVKRQGSEDNSSANGDSSLGDSQASKGKKSKSKKVKKAKSGKKDKKKKDKQKDKKKEKKEKKSDRAKEEAESKRQHKD